MNNTAYAPLLPGSGQLLTDDIRQGGDPAPLPSLGLLLAGTPATGMSFFVQTDLKVGQMQALAGNFQ